MTMIEYPYATQQILHPEAEREPIIRPWQIIFHTHGAKGTSEAIGKYFDREDVNVESHLSGKQDGRLIQFMPLNRQADANAAANGFRVPGVDELLGALSYESEDNANPKVPWSDDFIHTAGLFVAVMNQQFWIPLERCKNAKDAGIGHHSLFDAWNPHGHLCPGQMRATQVYRDIIPTGKWFLSLSKPSNTLIVDEYDDGKGHVWALQRDGGVITKKGNRFFGSFPGLPAKDRMGEHTFGDISGFRDGYVLTDTHGHEYHFAPTA